MPWSRYDDELPMNKKIGRLLAKGEAGAAAIGLHLLANTWSRHQGTGGHIEAHVPGQLVGSPRLGRKLAALLEEVRMFDVHDAGGWTIHDFDEYGDPNDPDPHRSTAERRKEISEKRSVAGRQGGLAKAAKRPSKASGLPVANAKQTSSPDPDPVPVFATGTGDDDRHHPDARSSSSRILHVAQRYAELMAQQPGHRTNPTAWKVGTARNAAIERRNEIAAALEAGHEPEQIAQRLAHGEPATPAPPPPEQHPSSCHCAGNGNGSNAGELTWDDHGTGYAAPCPGPERPHPSTSYLEQQPEATVIPIRSRTTA